MGAAISSAAKGVGKWLGKGGLKPMKEGVKTLAGGGKGSVGEGLKQVGSGFMKSRAMPIAAGVGGLGAGAALAS